MKIHFRDIGTLVGQEFGVSDWVEITQERVNQFAEATGDHQWIHVDVERATREIGGTIAHGFLTVSLITGLNTLEIEGLGRVINYGADNLRFTNMLRVGKRVRVRQKMLSADAKAGGVMLRCECTVDIEGETRPACVVETLLILYGA